LATSQEEQSSKQLVNYGFEVLIVIVTNVGIFSDTAPLAERWFLARLIFNPENGGDTFLRNNGSYHGKPSAISQKMTIFS
jgi:hypothetical protein